jgi:hypothetical protein
VIDIETRWRLEADVAAVAAFLAENDGAVEADSVEQGVYWLTMRPRTVPPERYYVHVAWERYPGAPPSVGFATAIGGELNVTSAWPLVPNYRPPSFDICMPFTKEGFALHSEWAGGREAWQTTGNPFLWVVELMQDHLDRLYQGRSA